jgi:hypothetical protein
MKTVIFGFLYPFLEGDFYNKDTHLLSTLALPQLAHPQPSELFYAKTGIAKFSAPANASLRKID